MQNPGSTYKEMGCRMSLKVHFLHSHLDAFPQNLGQFSDEQGERFHQGMLFLENRFQGKCHISLMANAIQLTRITIVREQVGIFQFNKNKHPN